MAGDTRVVLHQGAIADMARDPGIRPLLLEAAVPVVRGGQLAAPKLTGAGAASIHAEAVLDGPEWTAHVSWSRERYYMYFVHEGTSRLPARPFLVQTLEGLAR
jgi:hypothetical protein